MVATELRRIFTGANEHPTDLREHFKTGRGATVNVRLLATEDLAELRGLSMLNPTIGAYGIGQSTANTLELALLDASAIRRVASVERTQSGERRLYPSANDAANEAVVVLPEQTDITSASYEQDIAFGAIALGAHAFFSKRIRVPRGLMEDVGARLEKFLGQILGQRIGRGQNRLFTVGTGQPGQPTGLVTAAKSGVTAASPTAIAGDEVQELVNSVDPAYREIGAFMGHANILAIVQELKDSQGRYLYDVGRFGVGRELLGYPFVLNQHMASAPASGVKSMIFGALGKYQIRDVNEVRIQIYQEAVGLVEAGQMGFAGWHRSDGNLLDAGTHPVKALQH